MRKKFKEYFELYHSAKPCLGDKRKLTLLGKRLRSERKQFFKRVLKSPEWKELRQKVFDTHGNICLKCGSDFNMTVDHIKPKHLFINLLFDINNLQPLCFKCNTYKATTIIDYR